MSRHRVPARTTRLRVGLRWLALLFLFTSPGTSHAAWQTFDASSITGLANVNLIVQDSTGAMWFASSYAASLTRYDGLRWQSVQSPAVLTNQILALRDGSLGVIYQSSFGDISVGRVTDPGLGVRIECFGCGPFGADHFAEGPNGSIWLASKLGIVSDSGGTVRPIRVPVGTGVSAMASSPQGDVWVGLTNCYSYTNCLPSLGAARYRNGSWTRYGSGQGMPSDTVTAAFCDREGGAWLATPEGLAHFDSLSQERTYTQEDGLPGYDLLGFAEDSGGGIWAVQGQNSLLRFDGLRWRVYGTSDGVPAFVGGIASDREGNIWVATSTAVMRFDRVIDRLFSTPMINPPPGFEDRQGRIWFSNGVRFDQNTAQQFDHTGWQDREGRIWSGGCQGVERFEQDAWKTDSLSLLRGVGCVGNPVEDSVGTLWFPGADSTLFWSFDGTDWKVHRAPPSIPQRGPVLSPVYAERQSETLWMSLADSGVVRYEPNLDRWTLFEPADGVPGPSITEMLEDDADRMWAVSQFQIGHFDGSAWSSYSPPQASSLSRLTEDRTGILWCLIDRQVGLRTLLRFDGASWLDFQPSDPSLPSSYTDIGTDSHGEIWALGLGQGFNRYLIVRIFGDQEILEAAGATIPVQPPILEDHSGTIWSVRGLGGIAGYERDRTAPQTVLVSGPSRITSERKVVFSYVGGYGESQDVEFRSAVDGADTSAWSSQGNRELLMPDGPHVFEVWARDHAGNVDPTPARTSFEVDGTPPAAILSSPPFGAVVRGMVSVLGQAEDARFRSWSVDIRSADSTSWTPLASSLSPAPKGAELAHFDSRGFSEGEHLLRLSVADTLGLTGEAQVSITIDNLAPSADESSPAVIRRTAGGDVFTTDGHVHLYFPPYALAHDDSVRIDRLAGSATSEAGYSFGFAWRSGVLGTPAVLTIDLPDSLVSRKLAVWDSVDASGWRRVGGTIDAKGKQLSTPIKSAGAYALVTESGTVTGGVSLSPLSLLPRIFSPTGGYASRECAITFSLGQSASVTARVYNRAGRLMKEVASGVSLAAGSNVLRWDGRDREGATVQDGLYIVTIEALGQTQQSTVAVVH